MARISDLKLVLLAPWSGFVSDGFSNRTVLPNSYQMPLATWKGFIFPAPVLLPHQIFAHISMRTKIMRSMSCTSLKHASGRIILFCLNNHIILCTWWEECRRTLHVHLSLHQCSFYTLPSLPFQFPQLLHSTQWCLNNWGKKETKKQTKRKKELQN